MFYSSELSFICEVFKRHMLSTDVIERERWGEESPINDGTVFGEATSFCGLFDGFAERTVYKLTDNFGRSFRFFLLPECDTPTVMAVGPYLSSQLSSEDIYAIGEGNSVPPSAFARLHEYFSALPVITSEGHLASMLWVFCERIWRGHSFSVVDITDKLEAPDAPFVKTMEGRSAKDTLLNIKAMEARYEFENRMMNTITAGIPYADESFDNITSNQYFERRVADPLRNAKNYSIIMNTLSRKAAERGGVHPVQLNEVSSSFAARIEALTSIRENAMLMKDMLRTYSRLVRSQISKGCSEAVRRALIMIDADLSANITPGSLAESLGLSLGYFSALFKRETGKTVTEHIRGRRMEYAQYLLHSTALQVQTVAVHCGIVDVQYFSKLFKKHTGKTPTEFREALKV